MYKDYHSYKDRFEQTSARAIFVRLRVGPTANIAQFVSFGVQPLFWRVEVVPLVRRREKVGG
jgi:hypothetical protein